MIYISAIAFLLLSHFIYRKGKAGANISLLLEKLVILATAILSLFAILDLTTLLASMFSEKQQALAEVFIYPASILLFVLFILIVLPKPIPREPKD